MKFKIKFLLPLVASVALTGCEFSFKKIFNKEKNPDSFISKTEGFYKGYNLDMESVALESELQKLCFNKHKTYIPYSQYNTYCTVTTGKSGHNSIEGVAEGSKINEYFYTGKQATGTGTREHVWPCANSAGLWTHENSLKSVYNVDYSAYIGGGSDLFHVRTANSSVNTARGNSKFVDFDDPEFSTLTGIAEYTESNGKYALKIQGFETTVSGGKQYAQKCEPHDKMKGDVARIITYVWIHYGDHGYYPEGQVTNKGMVFNKSDMIGSLALTNIFGYDSFERCAQKIAEWNRIDPPSEVEKLRNNTVQGIQGNRNPFVDFPELIDQLFADYI